MISVQSRHKNALAKFVQFKLERFCKEISCTKSNWLLGRKFLCHNLDGLCSGNEIEITSEGRILLKRRLIVAEGKAGSRGKEILPLGSYNLNEIITTIKNYQSQFNFTYEKEKK